MNKRHVDNDFKNLPGSAQDFIKLIIKKMRYRKSIRRDVQAELTGHFEDELRSCTDQQQAQQKAKELIEQFGNAKLLGILLRRAKKRCRPLWRTVVVRTFQTIGILFLCLLIYSAWFLTGKPIITTNYVEVMNERVKPFADVDPNLNARMYYYKAAEILEQKKEEDGHYSDVVLIKPGEATAEDKEKIEQWFEDNKELLDMITAGSQLPYYWPEYKTGKEENATEAIAVLMPHLASYRIFVKAICLRAELKAEKGNFEDSFDDLLVCYRMGKHLKGDMTLIEQLVGISIEALATGTISEVLSQYEIDPAILARLQGDFEKVIADEDFAVSFEQEKFFMYDEIQRSFTVDRIGGGHLYLKRVGHIGALMGPSFKQNKFKYLIHLLFLHPDKQETLDAIDRFYGRFEQLSLISPAKRKAENVDMDKDFGQYSKGNFFLEILAPALGKVMQLGHRNQISVKSTVVILALVRYKQQAGDYPTDLQQLMKAGYIKEIPLDPFSDRPLVYRKTDDGFILYSVGLNFIDDGGQVYRDHKDRVRTWDDRGGDAVFWPVQR